LLPPKEKLEEIVKGLAKIMRIQDWDIELKLVNKYEMQEETEDKDNIAACYRNRKLKNATIWLNMDKDQENNWYLNIVHEMYHIVTDDWHYHVHSLLDFIKDESTNQILGNIMNIYYEQAIEVIAKGFTNAYPATNFIKEAT